MDEIIEQLKEFCGCFPCDVEDNKLEKTVKEAIHLISLLTCWTQRPCETFLMSERQEVFDMDNYLPCSCDDGIMELDLFYAPFALASFRVFSVHREGVKEIIRELDEKEFGYSVVKDKLLVDIRNYANRENGCCVCKKEHQLLVLYDAGFEELPQCLLQLFCDLIHVIYNKNNCDCHACATCQDNSDSGFIANEAMTTDELVESYLNKLVIDSYRKQLGLISLCGKSLEQIWGIRV
ncbi:hypothetical protein AAFC16_001870 [Enterococcus faecalis]